MKIWSSLEKSKKGDRLSVIGFNCSSSSLFNFYFRMHRENNLCTFFGRFFVQKQLENKKKTFGKFLAQKATKLICACALSTCFLGQVFVGKLNQLLKRSKNTSNSRRGLEFSNQKKGEVQVGFGMCKNCHDALNTVDERNPAPVDTVNIPLFTGFYASQVVSRTSFVNSIT